MLKEGREFKSSFDVACYGGKMALTTRLDAMKDALKVFQPTDVYAVNLRESATALAFALYAAASENDTDVDEFNVLSTDMMSRVNHIYDVVTEIHRNRKYLRDFIDIKKDADEVMYYLLKLTKIVQK